MERVGGKSEYGKCIPNLSITNVDKRWRHNGDLLEMCSLLVLRNLFSKAIQGIFNLFIWYWMHISAYK